MDKLTQKFAELFYPYRIFTIFALFFLSGILLASLVPLDFGRIWPSLILISFSLIFVSFLNLIWKNFSLALIGFSTIFLFVGLAIYSSFEARHRPSFVFDEVVSVEGRIAARPQIDFQSQKVILELENQSAGRVLVTLPHFPEYHFNDRIKVTGKLMEPTNFSDFDYRGYLKRYLVFGLIQRPDNVELTGRENNLAGRFLGGLYSASARFEQSLNQILSEPHASLAAGILLGIKRNIPDDLMEALNVTGLTHVVALSGFNVTIIVTVFSLLFTNSLGRRRVFIYGTLFVLFFVLMTGASSSVVRAAIFSFLILFGGQLGRQADQTNLMLLAAIIMVIVNPFVLRYDTGFQLSFLAFAGLIYLAPLIKKYFDQPRLAKIPEQPKFIMAETLGAQLAVFPLIWWQFGRLSLISPLANLLVVPIIPLVMGFVFIAGMINLILEPLGKIGLVLLWPLLEYMIRIVELLALLPYASIAK